MCRWHLKRSLPPRSLKRSAGNAPFFASKINRLCTKHRLILWSAADFQIVKRRVKGQPPLAGIFKGEQPLNSKPRPPAPIKNQQAISLRFFPGPYGSACVQHAEPSLAETRCIANKLLYRKISHCLVRSLFFSLLWSM